MQGKTLASANRRIYRYTFAVLSATCLSLPRIAAAQGLTGALVGTVKDEQGAILAGAFVRVTSASLIGGPATVLTNDRGQLRFPVLRPGTYVLDVELTGFEPYHEIDIHIGAGAILARTVVLKVAGVASRSSLKGRGHASTRAAAASKRGSGLSTCERSRHGDSACSTPSNPLPASRQLRLRAAP